MAGTAALTRRGVERLTRSLGGVTEGTRTPDTRDHNPVLYLLSYGHQGAPAAGSPVRGADL
jgi:hypothetical protein